MTSPFDLTGKVALITGGSRGLGKAMARGLAIAGADIIIASRDEDTLKRSLAEIMKGTQVRGKYLIADMTNRESVHELGQQAIAAMGQVDILINNAGGNVPEEADQIQDENWDKIVELNLSSCMALSRSVIPNMKERKWGRIIHISSIMGIASKRGRNAYSATKSALMGLARAQALELGPYGITSNCLAPGPFLTELPASVLSDEEKERFSDRTALKRWGQPEELAGPALLLASNAGSYITGETLVVDGGTLINTF
ncbi:3-oxoacyl-[acyl-carrier-protein] reductase FabG [Polystyrenella longa]|uniref:3-oxoacyl-[acyl-carrier-protein] reductase FabG n=2 Tax=Polystyrenella longa TaxID=2528007 RepID=A0A518CPJ3_9PLAN|nr:3-oxoacyl-[acyl-carrier-protein] reductase FabG [Polystyrenella longa]